MGWKVFSKADENKTKYLCAPTWEQVSEALKKLNIGPAQFERYFSINPQTLIKIRNGKRNLQAKYWHIVYGIVGYDDPRLDRSPKRSKKRTNKKKQKPKDTRIADLLK